ncbi:unnamed protein product [Mucor circinelloides]
MKNNILLTRVIRSLSENMIIDLTDASSESQCIGSLLTWPTEEFTHFKKQFEEIVDRLSLIESLVLEIRQVYQACQLPHDDHMAHIVKEERRLNSFPLPNGQRMRYGRREVAEEEDEEEEEENEDDENEDGEDDEEDDE